MTAPWKPANTPSSQFSLGNYVGNLLLVAVGGCHENWPLNNNTIPAVRANVVVLDGPEAGKEWLDALMFAVMVVDQFRHEAGSVVLGRVVAKRGRGNNDMYWINPEVTPQDDQWARAWDAAYPGRLAQLVQIAQSAFAVEEAKLGSGYAPQSQTAPPPPPPPPSAPPAYAQQQGAPPAYAQQPAQAAPAAPPAEAAPNFPPPPPAAPEPAAPAGSPPPWAPNAHILGGPAAPGDTSTPPY
jgi:hypothetical protein